VRIVLRADSGFAREELMAWCEANGIDHLFGLARNRRLLEQIAAELQAAEAEHKQTGKPARRFKDFTYATLDSWSRSRRVRCGFAKAARRICPCGGGVREGCDPGLWITAPAVLCSLVLVFRRESASPRKGLRAQL
jgi:Transposase DDE domain group 1